ncbi:MAG: type II toxin-antitoxin system RelE/ParE family toxin [Nanoarchaeota archaeon]|nr:type II toxin-antitoxin system RelE/ParE family toxin [Nanoarchaeota archaeon]
MYEIVISNEAKKQLAKLSQKVRERIGSALERIKIRPHKFARRLYKSQYYRVRTDDYRIILDIKDVQLIIYVIEVGYRGKIYKK